MAAVTSASFCLVVCLLVHSSGALVFIPVELGDDVTLRCKVDNYKPITAVKWSRPELDPDHVLLYRDGDFDPFNQDPSYKNRVDLKDREMKDGDVSLVLKNVTMEDKGTYKCWVGQGGTGSMKNDPISIIILEVGPPGDKDGNSQGLSVIEDPEIIPVELEEDITLPCKAADSKTVNAVEWIRPGLKPDHVLFYRDGHFDSDDQHPSYKNRVDLKDREVKDGDVSLVLKNVKLGDKGRYECRVDQGKRNRRKRSSSTNDPIKIIYLKVRPPGNMVGIILGVVGFLLTVLAPVGFLINNRCKKKNPNLPVPPDKAAADKTL